ncbi:hypothetical protein MSG28_000526 [Choristoneura fumiferana]|uniref:Uncharacterized protein n=1 Tax=Choristoneura fumiferana TaxID=7141 RepID=A0ACC0K0Z8_CHOFU|nr:hypothetical protein MSG28_000526 [Choristoneura fumiferana]
MESANNSKVSFEPGWNDPPKISYDPTQTPPKPRNFLNKRVAFPLSGANVSPVTLPPVNLPPMPNVALIAPPAPTPANSLHHNQPSGSSSCLTNEHILEEVSKILLQLLEASSELGSKSNDIKRRVRIMEQMWRDGKFNHDVQEQMKELACALRDDVPDKADEIHKSLMVNHVSAVGMWMPGVKQLIHHCIARSELLAIDKE